MLWRNVFVIVGAIFTVCFFWTFLFPLIGIPLWIHGRNKARRILGALRNGEPTSGRLLSVTLDRTQSINNQHPYRMEFEYDTPAGVRIGVIEGWDRSNADRVIGEHHWVVYEPGGDARACALWPPVR